MNHSLFSMRWLCVVLLIALLAGASSCSNRPTPQGQIPLSQVNAMFSDAERQTCVLFRGPVQNRVVPWFDGLTLAQALVAAHYTGMNDPRQIVLLRGGAPHDIRPADLFSGEVILVEPGDVVEIIP